MPKFKYTAKTKNGKTVKEVLNLSTKDDVIARLRAKGLLIISIIEVKEKEGGSSFLSSFSARKGKRSKIKPYDLAFLARNLSTTLSSGVTLLRSLEILSSQAESIKLENILKQCSEYIKEGLSLSEAIIKYPKAFSPLWRGLIEVGEASGNLPFVLEKLADFFEEEVSNATENMTDVIEPILIVVIGIVVGFFAVSMIQPMYSMLGGV